MGERDEMVKVHMKEWKRKCWKWEVGEKEEIVVTHQGMEKKILKMGNGRKGRNRKVIHERNGKENVGNVK